VKPPLKEKKKKDDGSRRSFNLSNSEKPDEVLFLLGGCENIRLFLSLRLEMVFDIRKRG
jgi:hypothetical protein